MLITIDSVNHYFTWYNYAIIDAINYCAINNTIISNFIKSYYEFQYSSEI